MTDDPDNYGRTGYQTFNYTLLNVTDDIPFKIVNDELRTTQLLDYEFQDLYELHIKSADSGNTSLVVISKLKIYVKGSAKQRCIKATLKPLWWGFFVKNLLRDFRSNIFAKKIRHWCLKWSEIYLCHLFFHH